LTVSPKILIIKSDKSELHKVEKFLFECFSEFNLPDNNFNKTVLCVSEAVMNSIEHGNQFDSNKTVTIEFKYNTGEIDILINDEGEGFEFKKVTNPTTKENIKKESGRGIHIIKSLSKSLIFNEKGNSVQLKIKCK
jgi:serine/threonine-protein kinase RsbW